jgi:hypothetical protein
MEFFNRLFDVIGIIDNNFDPKSRIQYFVSHKFTNYNKRMHDLKTIMYKYKFNRNEEKDDESTKILDEYGDYICHSKYETFSHFYCIDLIVELRNEWDDSIDKEDISIRN